MVPDKGASVARVLNDCYEIRYYKRGARMAIHRQQREQAMKKLAATLIEILSTADDPEPVLTAVVDGLCDRHDQHRF